MCSRAQIYDRAAVLGQRVHVLVCQLAELQDLRDRVLRTALPSVSGIEGPKIGGVHAYSPATAHTQVCVPYWAPGKAHALRTTMPSRSCLGT